MADANVLIAAYLRDSTVRRIVTLAGLQLLVPEYIFEEFRKHLPKLAKRARLGPAESRDLIDRLRDSFTIVPEELVRARIGDAVRVMKPIDEDDAAYLAAALCVPCDGIWSDDPHLKKQNAVPCYTTSELLDRLDKTGFRIEPRNP